MLPQMPYLGEPSQRNAMRKSGEGMRRARNFGFTIVICVLSTLVAGCAVLHGYLVTIRIQEIAARTLIERIDVQQEPTIADTGAVAIAVGLRQRAAGCENCDECCDTA